MSTAAARVRTWGVGTSIMRTCDVYVQLGWRHCPFHRVVAQLGQMCAVQREQMWSAVQSVHT